MLLSNIRQRTIQKLSSLVVNFHLIYWRQDTSFSRSLKFHGEDVNIQLSTIFCSVYVWLRCYFLRLILFFFLKFFPVLIITHSFPFYPFIFLFFFNFKSIRGVLLPNKSLYDGLLCDKQMQCHHSMTKNQVFITTHIFLVRTLIVYMY